MLAEPQRSSRPRTFRRPTGTPGSARNRRIRRPSVSRSSWANTVVWGSRTDIDSSLNQIRQANCTGNLCIVEDMSATSSDRYKWVALLNATLAVLLATLDGSITIIAMPDIFRGIHLDPLVPANSFYLLWMILGYLVVTSVLIVSLGRLGDMVAGSRSTGSAS